MNPSIEERVLARTDEVLALDKPAGLPSTGRSLDDPDCVQFHVHRYLGKMAWALHQLDQHTSGVLLFALKKSAVAAWQDRWPRVEKRYLAMVHGAVDGDRVIDVPIAPIDGPGPRRVRVSDGSDGSDGKAASTELRVLSVAGPYSLVECLLQTGRTHQIRVHLEAIGHPLMGETVYTDIPCGHHPRPALHAHSVSTDQPPPLAEILAPLPADIRLLMERLGLSLPGEPS